MADMNQADASLEAEQNNQPPEPGMVQCQISQKWLPEEDTVEFQGYRVSAEGKQILLERLRAGTGSGEAVRPGFWRRAGCIILDSVIIMVISVIVGIIYGIFIAVQLFSNGGVSNPPSLVTQMHKMMLVQAAIQIVIALLIVLYFGLMHGMRGATVGKMVGKLKVVNLDGTKIRMGTAMWRSICFVGPRLAITCILFVLYLIIVDIHTVQMISLGLGVMVLAYLLADIICALVDSQQQRAIHDRLAGTRVIYIDA